MSTIDWLPTIHIVEKYNKQFTANVNWTLYLSTSLPDLMQQIKDNVWNCLMKVKCIDRLVDEDFYNRLLASWMLWEFHPEAKWNWLEDIHIFRKP